METKEKKTRIVAWLAILAGLAAFSLIGYAGSLEPSAPPGPTMKTLDEVEPRIPVPASSAPAGTFYISEPGSYYLTGDRLCSGVGIVVESDNVTIDLMGYNLVGPAPVESTGISMEHRSNVEVRNGTVENFNYGIYAYGSSGRGHRIINVRVLSNVYRGIDLAGYGHLVRDCTAADNGGYAIVAGEGSTVTGNTACLNDSTAIIAGKGSTVTGNTAYKNQLTGIAAGSGATVCGNTAYLNEYIGISASSGSVVSGNSVYECNNTGIAVGSACTVSDNAVRSNQRHGISTSYGCTVTNNTAYYNNRADVDGYAGIRVNWGCLVKGNTCRANLKANLYISGDDSAVEENLVTDSSGSGIHFLGNNNFWANNRARGNAPDYFNGAGQTSGGGNWIF
ncbi:MAG: right-handed parallel beta-helix repeat-containing protein [Planctomycetota bacterium]|jgi:parallel beta-helix repeat protein